MPVSLPTKLEPGRVLTGLILFSGSPMLVDRGVSYVVLRTDGTCSWTCAVR